jgi:uncharacterized protein
MLRYLVLGGFLLSGCATARQRQPDATPAQQETAHATAARPAASPKAFWGTTPSDRAKGALLFVLEGPAGPVYLFGTMHSEPVSSMPALAADHFSQAGTVAFEVDMENLDPTRMLSRAMLPAGESLDKLLGPEAWQRLLQYLAGAIPPEALVRFRPWLACALLVNKAMGATPGADMMDLALLKRGRAEQKTVRFLETLDQQIEALDRTMDATMLTELSKELEKLPAMFTGLAEAYRAGDMAALEMLIQEAGQSDVDAGRMREMLGVRNERWIPFLEQLATEGGGFVAFGAAHLPGEDGVVALLRRRGHNVTRVLSPSSTK